MDEIVPLGPSLQTFFPSQGKDGFLRDYWRKTPLHVKGDASRLKQLCEELGTLDLATILAQCQIEVWQERASGAAPFRGSIAEALDAYDYQSGTIYAHLGSDARLTRWLHSLCLELGEFAGAARLSFFAVRENRGSKAHYDTSDVITVQLTGRKRWLLAPNRFVDNPDRNWSIGDPPPPFSNGKAAPTRIPEDAVAYELSPGDVLYTPRTWFHHVTAADEPSLSCAFTFPPVLWGEGLLLVLKQRLMNQPQFRQALCGTFGSGWNLGSTVQQAQSMLDLAKAEVAGLSMEDLFTIVQNPNDLMK